MQQRIRVFTAFSGYDSQLMALRRLQDSYDLNIDFVGWCELDKAAILSHNAVFSEYSKVHYPDITTIDWSSVADFDLLFYSSCCQSVSRTGAHGGFEKGSGTQSSLIWSSLDGIKEKMPKYCILENVDDMISKTYLPSFIKWQRSVDSLGYHSVAMVMNAADYGVPQIRKRLFMVSIRNDIKQNFSPPAHFPRRLSFDDIIEKKVDERYYFSHSEAVRYYLRLSGKEVDERTIANIAEPHDGHPVWWMPSLTCKDRHDGIVIPTLKATGYNYFKSKNCFSTGYYPQCAILEIWQGNCSKEIDYDVLIKTSKPSSAKITNAGCRLILE